MTIRRDIARLASEGSARAVRGGISRLPHAVVGTDFAIRAPHRPEAKRRIAAAAAGLLVPGTTVALDVGTTTLELARQLPPALRLSVVTPSLPAMLELATRPEVELVGLGGVLVAESQAFAGPATLAALRDLRVDQAFLGATAVRDGTVLGGNPWDTELKRALLRNADQVVLLADASKFTRGATYRVGALSEVDVLVVDGALGAEERARIEDAGVRLIVAPDEDGVRA
jgi:DeoR family fructose operon transcriptional repressor